MAWRTTIDPFWVRVLDSDGEACPRGVVLGVGRDESRKEASFNGVTGLVKLGFHYCVILPWCKQKCLGTFIGCPHLGIKAVCYCVSSLGLDFLGLKLQLAALPDRHFMVCCLGRRHKGEGEQ
jgi:hypothetical protein